MRRNHAKETGDRTLATATSSDRNDFGNYINLGPVQGTVTHITMLARASSPPLMTHVELLSPLGPSASIARGWVRGSSVSGGSGQKYLDHSVTFVKNSRLYLFARNDTGATITYAMWVFYFTEVS